LADQQARKAQARQLRDQAQALQQQGRIAEAIAGYRQSLGLWPDPELEDFVRKLEAGLAQTKPLPVPAPATQAPAAAVPTVNPVGVWRHEPSASWTIRRLPNGQYFAEETGLGYASGLGVWTPSGSFRIDYVTRDGAIKGIYEVIFDPAGHQASGTVPRTQRSAAQRQNKLDPHRRYRADVSAGCSCCAGHSRCSSCHCTSAGRPEHRQYRWREQWAHHAQHFHAR
jgi:hypothetical protein